MFSEICGNSGNNVKMRDFPHDCGMVDSCYGKRECERVCIASSCQRGIRERSETMVGRNGVWSLIKKIHRERMARRLKALFRDCYYRDVMILIMPAVSWCRRTPQLSPFSEERY